MDTPRPVSPSRTILVLDRDLKTAVRVRNSLSGDGFRVEEGTSGERGISRIGELHPDAVIADIDFPGFPGCSYLERIRAAHPDVPVVVLGRDPQLALSAFRSGAADFLAVPFDEPEIGERIGIVLSRTDPERECQRYAAMLDGLESERKEMGDLLNISSSFSVSGDSRSLLKRLTDLAAESMNCEAASILLVNSREKVLEFMVATGEKGQHLETVTVPLGEGIAGWVAVHGSSQIVNDTRTDVRFTGKVDEESGFVTRQILAVPMRLEGETIGVIEVINTRDNRVLGDHDRRMLENIGDRVGVVIETMRTIESQQNFYTQIINVLVRAIERKDVFSDGHAWKVAEFSHQISRTMNLSENDMNDLHFGSLLHDIGKIDMPSILFNKRVLTDRERDLLRQHPAKGAKLIEPITVWRTITPCILYHHEAWDGSGYPFGRSGGSIPLNARIVALAEAFTVMRSSNSYKHQLSLKEAVLELMRCAGKQFDPEIVRVFIGVLEKETAHY
jgi:response regulator RpfG family c-di-GMP phosphodiesterase